MSFTETEILQLARMAYEAASEPEIWPRFLERYTEALAADFAVLQIHDLGRHRSKVIAGFGISSPFAQSYNDYYSKLNPWRERGGTYFAAGRVNLSEELFPRSALERSEFYNDYMRHIDGGYGLSVILTREGQCAPTLSAQRETAGPFSEDQRAMVARLLQPSLSRAWITYRRLEILTAGETVLDTLAWGVVFLDSGGRVIYSNRAAEETFRAGDGLSLKNGELSAADSETDARLRKAINDLVTCCATPGPFAISVPRPSLRRDYQIVTAPVRSRFRQFVATPLPFTVLLITDPERQRSGSLDSLARLYELTPKEAMLSGRLAEGKSVRQAAEELSISYETARTHLRRIFNKTGTSRQAELVRLIEQLPADPAGAHD